MKQLKNLLDHLYIIISGTGCQSTKYLSLIPKRWHKHNHTLKQLKGKRDIGTNARIMLQTIVSEATESKTSLHATVQKNQQKHNEAFVCRYRKYK